MSDPSVGPAIFPVRRLNPALAGWTSEPATPPLAVLIVDDEPAVLSVVGLALQHLGYAARMALDGQDAIAWYREHWEEVQLIVLDVQMPGLDGVWTYMGLRQLNPGLRCCFMTGGAGWGGYTPELLQAIGAVHVFVKPVELVEFARVIRLLLEPEGGHG